MTFSWFPRYIKRNASILTNLLVKSDLKRVNQKKTKQITFFKPVLMFLCFVLVFWFFTIWTHLITCFVLFLQSYFHNFLFFEYFIIISIKLLKCVCNPVKMGFQLPFGGQFEDVSKAFKAFRANGAGARTGVTFFRYYLPRPLVILLEIIKNLR